MTRRPDLKSLVRVRFLLLSPFTGGLVPPLPLDEVTVRFLWSSGLYQTHCPLTARYYLYHYYYFPYFCIFQYLVWEVPGVGSLSPSALPIVVVGFLR